MYFANIYLPLFDEGFARMDSTYKAIDGTPSIP